MPSLKLCAMDTRLPLHTPNLLASQKPTDNPKLETNAPKISHPSSPQENWNYLNPVSNMGFTPEKRRP